MPKFEAWGDGSGAEKGLTTSFVSGEAFQILEETKMYCFPEIFGTAPVAVDLELQISVDGGENYDEIPLPIVAIRADTPFRVILPARCLARFRARRRGGDVLTEFYLGAFLRLNDGDWREADPAEINYAIALDDTAAGGGPGDGLTLTGAFQYGEDIEIGYGDLLELYVKKTSANNPDEVHIRVEKSIDSGTTDYPLDEIDGISGGETEQVAQTIVATDFDATNPMYRTYTVTNITPLTTVRVGAMYSGGTAPDVLIYARVLQK